MISDGIHDDPVEPLLSNVTIWQESLNYSVTLLTYDIGNSASIEIFLSRNFCYFKL